MPRAARASAPAAVLALAALCGRAAAQSGFADLCMETYKCRYEHYDPASSRIFRWDLSTLCKPSGHYSYSGFGTEGQVFTFNVCGNTSVIFSDYVSRLPMYESHGVAVQLLQNSRGVRNNAATSCLREDGITPCPDYTKGGNTCCSVQRCEVVALESFTFDLIDSTNPTSGGVLVTHTGFPGSENDFLLCPLQAPGLRRLRTFELYLTCNPNGSLYDLTITKYAEGNDGEGQYCRFQVWASTLAACGQPDAVPTPTPAPGPSADDVVNGLVSSGSLASRGSQVGYAVLGCVLTLAVQYLWAHGRSFYTKSSGASASGDGAVPSFGLSFTPRGGSGYGATTRFGSRGEGAPLNAPSL